MIKHLQGTILRLKFPVIFQYAAFAIQHFIFPEFSTRGKPFYEILVLAGIDKNVAKTIKYPSTCNTKPFIILIYHIIQPKQLQISLLKIKRSQRYLTEDKKEKLLSQTSDCNRLSINYFFWLYINHNIIMVQNKSLQMIVCKRCVKL